MLAVMLFAIFVGFPISFTLIFLGFHVRRLGREARKLLTFPDDACRPTQVMLDDQLVAVPLFIFMGIMMEQAG